MLLINKLNAKFPLLLMCLFIWTNAHASALPVEKADDLKPLLEQLAAENKQTEIASRWNNYIKDITHFDNDEYMIAIQRLNNKYSLAIITYGKCCEEIEDRQKDYSSEWIGELRERFGNEYILRNIDSIRLVLKMLYTKQKLAFCESSEKDAIFSEIQCTEAIRQYIRHFLDFTRTLNKKEQGSIKQQKLLANHISKLLKHPLQQMVADSGIKILLGSAAVDNRTNLKPELIEFLSQLPNFSKPFDLRKALADLQEVVKG